MVETADILRAPYVVGGRDPANGLDCYGVVLELARRKGLDLPDAWQVIADDWRRGKLEASSGFPPHWRCVWVASNEGAKLDMPHLQDGDVVLTHGRHHGCMIVHAGHLYSADPHIGAAYAVPLHRAFRAFKRPREVWRVDPTAHQEGTAG